ncbi:phosphoadenosine phosphosulfate reductase family protein [Paenibacillus prosopidis]|uniref:DNA sulfur modification protein DndC n=1 Tax=Paenibacillus prosopidis TaxID=630520 RepID=A0A368VT67_9BACL|nr:phosphoadenosine phosphosulfate reductase family protein [Paenibacillus prosopidis]RCW44241.1 DNA sulfur modification protein DndC [Paenibacillus prosopidis]
MDYKMKKMESIAEILKSYTQDNEGPWQVAYSGGKDSTVTLALVIRALLMLKPEQRNRTVYITSAQTHLDLTTDPTKQREFEKIQALVDKHNLPVVIKEVEAKPSSSFVYCVLGLGYPLPRNDSRERWCTHKIKKEPQAKYMKELNPSLVVIGVRNSESASRERKIKELLSEGSEYYGDNGTFMPVVKFTVEDIWEYLSNDKTPWGDAEEISQLYKDATGECGLRGKRAGKDENNKDVCGARFGCVICPVVKIDHSTKEMAKKKPWFEPYVELRNIMIKMFDVPHNRSGYRRNGIKMGYGKGTFSIKARSELLEHFLKAQEDNRILSLMHGVEPQPIINDEMLQAIYDQWKKDASEKPWLEDAEELGRFFEAFNKKANAEGYQIVWNHLYDTPQEVSV